MRDVEVREIVIPGQLVLVLLRNFARILNAKYTNLEWKAVGEAMKDFRWIGTVVNCIKWAWRALDDRQVCYMIHRKIKYKNESANARHATAGRAQDAWEKWCDVILARKRVTGTTS